MKRQVPTCSIIPNSGHLTGTLNLKFGSKHLGAYNMYFGIGLRYLSPYNPDMTQKLTINFTVGFRAF